MLRSLHLKDVGPAPELKFEFAPRLNLLTGDNGLGKTLVLDVIWWLLTTTWVGEMAFPRSPTPLPKLEPGGGYGIPLPRFGDRHFESPDGSGGTIMPGIAGLLAHRAGDLAEMDIQTGGTYVWERQEWVRTPYFLKRRTAGFKSIEEQHDEAEFRPPSLVLYVRTDGSFAVWDSYRVKGGIREFGDAAMLFDAGEVWEGKFPPGAGDRRVAPLCRGLIEDWRSWQKERSPVFETLRRVLHELSEQDEPLVPGTPARVKLNDAREIPTLSTGYGEVPVTLASAAVKRVLGIAYLLVWTWTEHVETAKLSHRTPTSDMVVLIDEVELHLHPQWQRRVVPALLRAVGTYAPNAGVQVVATTHSPLVLASLEPRFDTRCDALFTFDLTHGRHERHVRVEKAKWRQMGDASNWLTSHVFDLKAARSREAEDALEAAMKALDNPKLTPEQARAVHRQLHDVLKDTDPFWGRWMMTAEKLGIEP